MKYSDYERIERTKKYINNMRPVLNKAALFSDETADYRQPAEPEENDTVEIFFRTAKDNVDLVFLIHEEERILMNKVKTEGLFDYYSTGISLGAISYSYYFEVHAGKITCFYHKKGLSVQKEEIFNFEIIPGFSTPDWAKGAVMYQIFTDRFCNGDPANDVVDREYIYIQEPVRKVDDWERCPAEMDVREFYGGDLQGVWDKLDYLQDLGVEVIYFNPLFVSPSNHKYDTQDYDYIDPHFGKIVKDEGNALEEGDRDNHHATKYISRVTDIENLEASNAFFARLVEEIHRRGMKVILDGVFNHCGSFNKWMDRERLYEDSDAYEKGAYISEDSPYRDFFRFNKEEWPYNQSYDGWWGHDTLPKLNYEESKKLHDYVMHIGKKWVSPPFNVDGWRLDVAADLGVTEEYNHIFWKDFRKAVKEANPNALILAEHYGNPSAWLRGDEWDTVMNYDAFMEPVTWFLTGMEKHSDAFREDLYGNADAFVSAMTHHSACFQASSLQVAMNELSNHDHSRFLTRTNHKVGRIQTLGSEAASQDIHVGVFREAVILQMTWPGAPTVYYGDEAGVCGFTDPDNRRTYPWGRENFELIDFHRYVIEIRKKNPVLATGSVKFLGQGYQYLAYGRFNREAQIVVVINNDSEPKNVEIPVWQIGVLKNAVMEQLIMSGENSYSVGRLRHEVVDGKLSLKLPKMSASIYRAVQENV